MSDQTTSKADKRMLWLSGIVVAVMTAVSAWAWQIIPAGTQIPVHWDMTGTPDRYGSKLEGLFLMPAIVAGVVILLAVIPHIDPRRENLAQSRKAYNAVWTAILLFMGGLHVAVVLSVMGYPIDFGVWLPAVVGVLFIVIGNYMGKVRSNFMFGIRTPWTLASEMSWNKTHRLGGKLFVALGLYLLASAFLFRPGVWAISFAAVLFAVLMVLFVYSYIVWRNDPATD